MMALGIGLGPPDHEGADILFVARSDGAWLATPLPGDVPRPVSLADLCALITAPVEPPADLRATIPDGATFGPGAAVVGPLTESGWCLVNGAGERFVIGPDLLVVLDGIHASTTTAGLSATARSAVALLVRAGALVVTHVPAALALSPGGRPGGPNQDGAPGLRGALGRWRRTPPVEPAPAAAPAVEPDRPEPVVVPARGGPAPGGPAGRVPVYAIWHPRVGPLLSLGMLSAAARHHRGGALNEVFEIRRPEEADSFLADLATRTGPAVLLCSDYVWSIDQNLAAAREALAINPQLLVVHGGPSSPKYQGDAEEFLARHGEIAHVLTRGEGEGVVCELLDALATTLPAFDPAALAAIQGLTFTDPGTGQVVRTPDRDRLADLDSLPSPYLTGEFDHIPASAWNYCMSVETNRGCPYGCTFCDWGSATLSRIRKFDLDRVAREVEWASARGVTTINIPDANFGIMSRDVDTADHIARIKRRLGFPEAVVYYPAKNTTKHLARITDIFAEASISAIAALSLQTTDPATLDAIERSNISTDHYVALAADHRRRGHHVHGDLLLGLPAQTYASYRSDLQFMLDHEILERTWLLQVLPNAPMNDPAYREKHQVRIDEDRVVVGTATFDEADRQRMFRLRKIDMTVEAFGVLRHVLRWLQWDHGIPATHVMDHILDVTDLTPTRFPHLSWLVGYFDLIPTAPGGWTPFYREVAQLIVEDFGVEPSTALDCAIAINRFLMPAPGRTFPDHLELTHDYAAYYLDATRSLYADGHSSGPSRPLHEYGPATFTVWSDPIGLCTNGLRFPGDTRDEVVQGDFYIAAAMANELYSPLVRLLPHMIRCLTADEVRAVLAPRLPSPSAGSDPESPAGADEWEPVPVALGPPRRA